MSDIPTTRSDVSGSSTLSGKSTRGIDPGINGFSHVLTSGADIVQKIKEKAKESSPDFNPFIGLIKLGELDDSRILGWLFNPRASHGQGPLFLHAFLESLKIHEPEKGTWRVDVERAHVDLKLSREEPKSVVVIENKSKGANDQPNQLYRYWKHQIEPYFGENPEPNSEFYRIVYLAPNRGKTPELQSYSRPSDLDDGPKEIQYEHLTYGALAQTLQGVLEKVPASNTRIRHFLEFYLERCQHLKNPLAMNESNINSLISLFDSPAKWEAYLEIMRSHGPIREIIQNTFFNPLRG